MKFVGHIDDKELLAILKSLGLTSKAEMRKAIAAIKRAQKEEMERHLVAIRGAKKEVKSKIFSTVQTIGEQSFHFQAGVNYTWDELQCLAQFFPKDTYRLSEPSDLNHSDWVVRMLQTVDIKVDVTVLED